MTRELLQLLLEHRLLVVAHKMVVERSLSIALPHAVVVGLDHGRADHQTKRGAFRPPLRLRQIRLAEPMLFVTTEGYTTLRDPQSQRFLSLLAKGNAYTALISPRVCCPCSGSE